MTYQTTPRFKWRYPDDQESTRTWEHWQAQVTDIEATLGMFLNATDNITVMRVQHLQTSSDAGGNIIFSTGTGGKMPKAIFGFLGNGGGTSALLQAVGKPVWNVGATSTDYGFMSYFRSDTGAILPNNPIDLYLLILA